MASVAVQQPINMGLESVSTPMICTLLAISVSADDNLGAASSGLTLAYDAYIDAGTLDLAAASAGGIGAISSTAASATWATESAPQPGGTASFRNSIASFNASSVLDLKGFTVTATSYASGTLTLTGTLANGTAQTERYSFISPSSTAFVTSSDGNGGTDVIVCFTSGTLIRTARGDVAVEALTIGDVAVTASGDHRPIRWIGHQTHRPAGPMQPRSLWPVRVAAGAFGDCRPSADLLLSPGHSICVSIIDEVLVPIQELVNGSTIAYVERDEVTYWHVELDSHDILVANGMPAESFLEMGANRAVFDNGRGLGDPSAEVIGRSHADFCRPFVDGGPVLAALRLQLDARAAALGWQPSHAVAIAATVAMADGPRVLAPLLRGGEAIFALPAGAGDLHLASCMTLPALMGGPDPRRIGVAVYALELVGADGTTRRLDLDSDDLAPCFHAGERDEGLHYRYTSGEIVVPAAAHADLAAPSCCA